MGRTEPLANRSFIIPLVNGMDVKTKVGALDFGSMQKVGGVVFFPRKQNTIPKALMIGSIHVDGTQCKGPSEKKNGLRLRIRKTAPLRRFSVGWLVGHITVSCYGFVYQFTGCCRLNVEMQLGQTFGPPQGPQSLH